MLEKIIFFVISLVALGFLILIHELGHFIFCKIFSIPAPLFSIGFGPQIFSRSFFGTEFSLRLLPLGGYVAIGDQKEETEVNILHSYSLYKGVLVILGGIIFNIVTAYLMCIALAVTCHLEKSSLKSFIATPRVELVKEDGVAFGMGIKPGDSILKINDMAVVSARDIQKISSLQLKNITIERPEHGIIVCNYSGDNVPQLGITCSIKNCENFSFGERAKIGMQVATQITRETIEGLGNLFYHKKVKQFSGFIGILRAGASALSESFASLVATLVLISINLAVINLLPLPVLDGGQLFLLVLARIMKRPLNKRFQDMFLYFSIAILVLLTAMTTFYDIARWIGFL